MTNIQTQLAKAHKHFYDGGHWGDEKQLNTLLNTTSDMH